jgi:hypothetical protein
MQNQSNTKINKVYLLTVLLLMFVLPTAAILIEVYTSKQSLSISLMGKWFVFFAIGLRLFTAGLKQAITPSFTAQSIFHIQDKASFVVVRELGFANICFGLLGIASLFVPQLCIAAACTGGFYLGIAGIQHIIKKPVSANEWLAMVSDMFIFLLMIAYVFTYISSKP